MSHQPSPAPGPSIGRTKPLTTKAMAPPGIAQNVEEGKYQAKYKELKKKVKEIELDNDKMFYKVIAVKRNIQRMRLERAVLYERLAALPPSPHPSGNPLPPMQQPSPALPHLGYPVDVGVSGPTHSDARERDLDEYLRAHPNANVRVVAGPDGRPILLDEQHPNLAPPSARMHHSQHQRSSTPPIPHIRHTSGVSAGHDSVVDRDRQLTSLSLATEPYDIRHTNAVRSSHDHGHPFAASAYAQQQQQSYVRGQSPREPSPAPAAYTVTQQQAAQPSGPSSTPTSPSSTRSNSHSHSRLHNHQRVGPGANMNTDEWQRQREERNRERELEREREAQRAARAGSPVTTASAPDISGAEVHSIILRTATPGASYRGSPQPDAPGDETRKRSRSAIDDGGDVGRRSGRASSSPSSASAGGAPAGSTLPDEAGRFVKRVQRMHPEGVAVTPAATTPVESNEKDGDTELMDTE